jgi:hypothetical protein
MDLEILAPQSLDDGCADAGRSAGDENRVVIGKWHRGFPDCDSRLSSDGVAG